MTREWNSFEGGKKWRVTTCGVETEEGFPRTSGNPSSMYNLLKDYGNDIEVASVRFDLPKALIMSMIGIEAARIDADRSHFDARSLRLEPGYVSDTKTPNKVSPGLMQTLISTADWMNDKYDLYYDVEGQKEPPSREDLFIPYRSILAGAAYLKYQMDRYDMLYADPVLLCAAYNAGSIRYTDSNPWHLVTYSDDRIDRCIEFYNDALCVLNME